ncbi:hypothetical protein D3C87_2110030 [compost metagenome]
MCLGQLTREDLGPAQAVPGADVLSHDGQRTLERIHRASEIVAQQRCKALGRQGPPVARMPLQGRISEIAGLFGIARGQRE